MRILLISLFVCFSATNLLAISNEKLFEKLNQLYQSDQQTCFDMCKKFIDKKPENSIPYYFASRIYYDKSKKSQTLRGVYLNLNRSVRRAASFETYSDEKLKQLVQWDKHLTSLKERSTKLILILNKNSLSDLSAEMIESLASVQSFSENTIDDEVDLLANLGAKPTPKNIADNTETDSNNSFSNGQYFGIPNGLEIVLSSNTDFEQNVLQSINAERKKRGLSMLTWNSKLANASRYHAYDMATQGYFSHSSKDLINGNLEVVGNAFERIEKFYSPGAMGECVAMGNTDAYKTYLQWFNSKTHSDIMFHPDAHSVGIGYINVQNEPYWVLATAD